LFEIYLWYVWTQKSGNRFSWLPPYAVVPVFNCGGYTAVAVAVFFCRLFLCHVRA
jgi:hypothetical protein